MHSVHDGLSIVVPIMPDRLHCLTSLLDQIEKNQNSNSLIPFGKSQTILYASGVIVPVQRYGKTDLPANFMFFTSFSGPLEEHLDDLISIGRIGICRLFANCYNFPEYCSTNVVLLKRFLRRYNHDHTFYSGLHHLTPLDIKREEELRKEIKSFVDKGQLVGQFQGKTPLAIKRTIAGHIMMLDHFVWSQTPVKLSFQDMSQRYHISSFARLGAAAIIAALLPARWRRLIPKALLVALFLLILMIIYVESQPSKKIAPPGDNVLLPVMATQVNPLMNELTAANVLKGGWIRRLIFRFILRVVAKFTGMINIPTVATARWLATDNGKRLVFISNYSHTSESYVRDFINSSSSAKGINLLFGHGEGFPPTRGLIGNGTLADPEGFMNAVRVALQPRGFWYCTQKYLSVDNINNNRKLREGLFTPMTDKDSQRWLDRLS